MPSYRLWGLSLGTRGTNSPDCAFSYMALKEQRLLKTIKGMSTFPQLLSSV